ncbi:MAG: carboxylesterase family protein [Bacilli bacterium]|nr:carboxylesterase family protein [Bacilli bacterium]
MKTVKINTDFGIFCGNEKDNCVELLGLQFAKTKRFEYASLIEKYGEVNATKFAPAVMQKRAFPEFEHLEVPERAFYHKEFREGINFEYGEEGLYFNIYLPKEGNNHPVIIFYHGGGFDSGSINESPFNGEELAKKGNIVIFATYRVGIFGYLTHEEIYKKFGRDGNFGLDDMVQALNWVNRHIDQFGGDKNNITVMGQSAGAMSIQYLICSEKANDLFHKAIMMSGAGLFPKFSLPKPYKETREYWNEVIALAGYKTFEEFKNTSPRTLLEAVDKQKTLRKDNTRNTMPVIDDYYLTDSVDKLMKTPKEMPLIVGVTNNDMYTILLSHIGKKYAKKHKGYLYYFDIDAKGDNNQAFHSSDLRYVFGTLSTSWRPYDENDYKVSQMMMDYISNFARSGNPNDESLPHWDTYKSKALHITEKETKQQRIHNWKLFKNTFKSDPK